MGTEENEDSRGHGWRRRLLRIGLGVALGAVVADLLSRPRLRRTSRKTAGSGAFGEGRRRFERAITVNRPVHEVFAFWRDLTNLPRFMAHLERVEVLDERRSHWVAKAPMGRTIEWDAEIVAEEADSLIAWRALEPARVPSDGAVSFRAAPGRRGTEVRASISYRPPAGALGVAVAKISGEEPDQQAREDLRRLKQVLECGEVIRVEEQPSGRGPVAQRITAAMRRRLATGGRP